MSDEKTAGADASIDSIIDNAVLTEATPNEVPAKDGGDVKAPKTYTEEDFKRVENELARERRRIGKITAQKYQYKAQIDQYNQQLAERAKTDQPQNDAPQASQFKTYDEYLDAKVDHKLEKTKTEAAARQQSAQPDYQKQLWRTQRAPVMEASVVAAKQMFPDFQQKLEAHGAVLNSLSQDTVDALLEAENGAVAVYQLLEDGLLPHLNGMNADTVQALIERAEDKALSNKKTPVTKAPAPMASARGTAPGTKSPEKMTNDEFRKWMKS